MVPKLFAMSAAKGLEQLPDALLSPAFVVVHDGKLIWVGPPVGLHGERFAAPDHLASGKTEVFPSPQRMFAGKAFGGAVPAFHRLDGPAIADRYAADVDFLCEGRPLGCRQYGRVTRHIRPNAPNVRQTHPRP